MIYTDNDVPRKDSFVPANMVETIEDYREKVRKGLVPCTLPHCPRCHVESIHFKVHDKRPRKFLVPVLQVVQIVRCLLARWKCTGCGKTFTQYPAFALPYKRHVLPTMLHYLSRYVNEDETTYRRLLQQEPLGYEDHEQRQMDHTTPLRWAETFARLEQVLRKGQHLILQADPSSSICRDLANLTVAKGKYRSDGGKRRLTRCRQFFFLEAWFQKTFLVSIFPNLATHCGFA